MWEAYDSASFGGCYTTLMSEDRQIWAEKNRGAVAHKFRHPHTVVTVRRQFRRNKVDAPWNTFISFSSPADADFAYNRYWLLYKLCRVTAHPGAPQQQQPLLQQPQQQQLLRLQPQQHGLGPTSSAAATTSSQFTNDPNAEGVIGGGTYFTTHRAPLLGNLREGMTGDISNNVNWDILPHFLDGNNGQTVGGGAECTGSMAPLHYGPIQQQQYQELARINTTPNCGLITQIGATDLHPTEQIVGAVVPEPVPIPRATTIPNVPAISSLQNLVEYLRGILSPGQFFDRASLNYTSKDLIGKGSFGRVYRATNGASEVAIKVINLDPSIQPTPDFNGIAKEVLNLRSVAHSNLVSCMGVCVDEKAKEFSIVFDRMECSLTALLEKQDLPTKMRKYIKLTYEQKLDIFLQMLTVIEFLHNTAHMVHCDIKLDNFLLDANLKLKLCDLGFAKLIWESKPIASGTQLYMAPELWKQKGYGPSSPASDIYALSFTMYQLLYEWPLFEADVTATEDSFVNSVVLGLVRPNLSKQPKDPDIKIPLQPCLVKMFTRCWHPDPSSRLTATEALALVNEAITLYQTRSQGLLSYLAYKFHY